jgi:hypothetical protein
MLIVEIPPKKDKDGKPVDPDKEPDESEFKGTLDDVLAKLKDLRKEGRASELTHLQFTTAENQEATGRVGATKPFVMGMTRTGGGITTRSLTYRDVGTQAQVKARIAPEKTVALELRLEDVRVPDDGVAIGTDENNKPVYAPEFVHSSFNDKVSVPAGQAVLVKGVKTTAKSGQVRTLVFVAARVVEPAGK